MAEGGREEGETRRIQGPEAYLPWLTSILGEWLVPQTQLTFPHSAHQSIVLAQLLGGWSFVEQW